MFLNDNYLPYNFQIAPRKKDHGGDRKAKT